MPTINLWVKEGYLTTPDGNSIYFWGYSTTENGPAQIPGPHIVVRQGESVTITLHNQLSSPIEEPVSTYFPGQRNVRVGAEPTTPQYDLQGKLFSFTNYVLPNGPALSYTFTPEKPGTYLYQSGTLPFRQVLLGLYGALIVRPADYDPLIPAYKTCYGHGTDTEFDREYLLITSEIDPQFHDAVRLGIPFVYNGFKPRYWLLNGRCAPDTMDMDHLPQLPHQPYGAMIFAQPEEKVLIRYVGAGIQNHPLHPHGNHTRVIAVDGNLLRKGNRDCSYKRFTVLVGTGQTYDQIFTWSGLGYTPENPIPTTMPNVRNLGIGDMGITLWSGSPYLGVKDDIPVGVVSYNMSGEYYFMLHSHEEPQITNWGEFPGGLMTMIGITENLSPDVGEIR